jgi:hypothetical protein
MVLVFLEQVERLEPAELTGSGAREGTGIAGSLLDGAPPVLDL